MKFLISILIFTISVYGVVNVEQIEPKENNISGEVEFSFSEYQSSVIIKDYEASTKILFDHKKFAEYLIASYNYAETENRVSKDKKFLHLRELFAYLQQLIFETYIQTEQDEIISLKERSILGIGARYRFFKSKKDKFYLGLGGFYEKRHYDNKTIIAKDEANRGNLYIAYTDELDKNIKAGLVLYYQPKFIDNRDYYLKAEGSLKFTLNNHISLKLTASQKEETKPFEGNAKKIKFYKTVLSYKF